MGGKAWCAAMAAMVAAQPLAAAELYSDNRTAQRSGAFAGATLTMSLDGSRQRPARTRVGLGISRIHYSSLSTDRLDRRLSPGVGFALEGGRAQFQIGGSSLQETRARLGMSSTTTTLLVLGGGRDRRRRHHGTQRRRRRG